MQKIRKNIDVISSTMGGGSVVIARNWAVDNNGGRDDKCDFPGLDIDLT